MSDPTTVEPRILFSRTSARHERGTLLLMHAAILVLNLAMIVLLLWVISYQIQYSIPGIYDRRELTLLWGPHGP